MTPALRTQVLREWQPWSAPPALTKPAPALDQLVPGVMKRLGIEQRLYEAQVFHQWSQIVGTEVAKHAQPVSLTNKLLRVSIDHPVWHQQLLPLKPLILQKVRDRIGKAAVRDIVFRIG
ncbi:MAG: hypothetical protein PCFJNLEI_03737 [Verrucomicrobiae bacterium]|nr:hypothetical protein [Verrucomicrobiae bacterium]